MRNYKIKLIDTDTEKIEKHVVKKASFAEAVVAAQSMIHLVKMHGKRILSIQEG
tara:strand:+ start:699 stop:860 length:162 start_codon:yes stop_codon:yes gene_type:complete